MSYAATLVVVRILAPGDYGLVGMSGLLIHFAAILAEFGIGTTIVTRRLVDPVLLRQLNAASMIAGVLLFATTSALAIPAARFFRQSELVWLIPAQAIGFLLDTGRSAPLGVLLRDGQFRRVAKLDVIRQSTAAITTLMFALLGWGYWALVSGPVMSSLVACVVSQSWVRIGFQWPRWLRVRDEISHASVVLSSQVLWFFFMNSPFFIVGRRFGAAAFGLMAIAWLMCLQPLDKIGSVVTPVLTSAFAVTAPEQRIMGSAVLLVGEAMFLIYGLLLGGLAVTSDLAVPLILGPKWEAAVDVVRYFSIFAVMYGVVSVLQNVLIARGEARVVVQANAAGLVVLGGGGLLFVTSGGADVMARWWATGYPLVAWWPLYVLARREGLSMAAVVPVVVRASAVVAASLLAVYLVRFFWPSTRNDWSQLLVSAACGGLVFLVALVKTNGPLAGFLRRRLLGSREEGLA